MILRWILFLGLILHKLLWEVLKRRDGASKGKKQPSKELHIVFVKFFKVMILIFLVFQTLFLDLLPISGRPTPAAALRIIGTMIYFIGLAMAVSGRLQLGENWVDLEDYQVLQKQSLVTNGIYRYIRHPIYAGDTLLIIGLELALNSWLVLGSSVLLLVVIRQALAEESLMSQVFSGYNTYCRRTKRFIPFIV